MKFVDKDYNMLAFGRFHEIGGHSLIVINNADYEIEKVFKVWYLGVPKECEMEVIMETHADGFSTGGERLPVEAGKIKVKLGPKSGVIIRYRDDTPTEAVTKSNNEAAGRSYGGVSMERSSWFNFGHD